MSFQSNFKSIFNMIIGHAEQIKCDLQNKFELKISSEFDEKQFDIFLKQLGDVEYTVKEDDVNPSSVAKFIVYKSVEIPPSGEKCDIIVMVKYNVENGKVINPIFLIFPLRGVMR